MILLTLGVTSVLSQVVHLKMSGVQRIDFEKNGEFVVRLTPGKGSIEFGDDSKENSNHTTEETVCENYCSDPRKPPIFPRDENHFSAPQKKTLFPAKKTTIQPQETYPFLLEVWYTARCITIQGMQTTTRILII